MAFRVEISPEAFENLDTIAAYLQERGSFESDPSGYAPAMSSR